MCVHPHICKVCVFLSTLHKSVGWIVEIFEVLCTNLDFLTNYWRLKKHGPVDIQLEYLKSMCVVLLCYIFF